MRVVLAPDSFKECLPAEEVCRHLAKGFLAVRPDLEVRSVPMADGGEGTLAAIRFAKGGEEVRRPVTGPQGRPVTGAYLRLGAGLVVVEAATACGLPLIPPGGRNPLLTTTRGVGELVLAALQEGAESLLLALGGSGTVDGGTGMARALGYRFLDGAGRELPEGGGSLVRLAQILPPPGRPWTGCAVEGLADVRNPLLGPEGAAPVFGPQKGATQTMVRRLAAGLEQLARVAARDLGLVAADLPGSGAAGGLGFAVVVFLGGRLVAGVERIAALVGLEEALRGAALCVTGEGRFDAQSRWGKVCFGVGRAAARLRVPCVVVAGRAAGEQAEAAHLFREVLALTPPHEPFSETVRRTPERLEAAGAALARRYLRS